MECTVKNVRVEYEIIGHGKPIVIPHTSMISDMEPVFEKRSGWKRVYINYPGIGSTEVKDWMKSSDDVLDVLVNSIDTILGEEKFLLAGFSYSAYLARGVLKKRSEQVEGIALICPLIKADSSKRDTPNKVVFKDNELISNLTSEKIEELSPFCIWDKHLLERLKESESQSPIAFNMEFYNMLKQTGCFEYSFDVDRLEKPFDKPSLIIMGRQDSVVGYKDAWNIIENYPRAAFSILDMSGHYIFMEHLYIVRELIGEWLDRIEKDYYRYERYDIQ